ncbi:MAG: RNA polymerase factor sigma-54 [Burkholderiaceae bacterium]|nr:RNA polymerase factor sigma-54 [Burkholderiaceae bacterium]
MKQGLSLRVSQHLALTPQLQQSIRLLQLSTLELSQEVEQALTDNPFLELVAEEAPREEFGLAQADAPVVSSAPESDEFGGPLNSDLDTPQDATQSIADYTEYTPASTQNTAETSLEPGLASNDNADHALSEPDDWGGDGSVEMSPDDSEWGGEAPASAGSKQQNPDADVDATELARQQESLPTHLHRQALALRLSEVDSAALRYLIESLNDDGYLEDSLASLAHSLGDPNDIEQQDELVHRFTMALHLLQSLEPTGVGARDLSECLSLQLRARLAELDADTESATAQTCQTALRILKQPIDLLARRDLKRLIQLCDQTEGQIKAAIALIARLEPKPGRRFADVQRNIVVPDVFVVRVGSGARVQFRAQLNSDVMPRLRVHDLYANALKNFKGDGASGAMALQQRLQEARWFIKSIQQRFDTILRVSNAIIERQKSFFLHGELAMRPLVLRDIADELGLHESTISRVTTAKYMSTPFGTFELKYFFGSGLSTEGGSNASSTAVRALIKQFVNAENPKKPLSDNKIAAMLKEQGIDCARRTVAKYRDALKIAPTNLRKLL